MTTIEELVARFSGLPPTSGDRWNVSPLVADRIYLSRDESGRFAVFIVGDERSFGTFPKISGIVHSSGIVPLPSGRPFPALRLTSASLANGNRIMAHIAYELVRRLAADGTVGNAVLISDVAWILELLADEEETLTLERQVGLVGELNLLKRLLLVAREMGMPAHEALTRWWGYERSKRDFASASIAIEVKTTSGEKREHIIGSLDQLEPQPGQEILIYSMGVRTDPTATRKLPAFVKDVEQAIRKLDGSPDEAALELFRTGIAKYGYVAAREGLYETCPGFLSIHLPPKLFRERDLDRLRLTSFKDDRLPSDVRGLMYVLEVRATALSEEEESAALRRLLESACCTG